MEKSSVVILTQDDLSKYHSGVVSKRIQESWGFSFDQLKSIIESDSFSMLPEPDGLPERGNIEILQPALH